MASKPKSFKLNEKKKSIVLYTNIERTPAEQTLVDYYLNKGYMPLLEEKKSTTLADMRKALKGTPAAEEFEKAYAEEGGFFKACKIYSEWKKNNK